MSSAVEQLNAIGFFTFKLSKRYQIISAILVALYLLLISWTAMDVFIFTDTDKTLSMITQLSIWRVCNLILWIMLIILIRSRKKATYHNYAYICLLLIAMFISNNYLFSHYSKVYFAQSGYMVFLFTFFIALPLHEQYKLNKQ